MLIKNLKLILSISPHILIHRLWTCPELQLPEQKDWERSTVSLDQNQQFQSIISYYFDGASGGRVENQFGSLNTDEVSKISNDSTTRYAALFESDDPYVYTSLIISESTDSSYAFIMQYKPGHAWYDSIGYDHSKWNYFTGDIYYYDLEGSPFGYSCMKDGTTDEDCTIEAINGRAEDVIISCRTTLWITIACTRDVCEVTNIEYESTCTTTVINESTGSTDTDPYQHPDARECNYDSNYDCNPPSDPTPSRLPSCGLGTVYDPVSERCISPADLWEQDICEKTAFKNNDCVQGIWEIMKKTIQALKRFPHSWEINQ